ncbi:MAG: L-seryl-tRNA(Sec) selenium transferase [Pirellulaceae bacterium]|jgi:L-seryl-tRNA(Ser) seleniumtransferase|nr:L-seryl-tRNA(Sec) selenium transferase [Pirellulaceae bacterium]
MSNVLRNIPSVNELLESAALRKLMERASRSVVVSGVRDFLGNLRSEVQSAAADIKLPTATELAERIARWIQHEEQPTLRSVVNATGILLHTGLGRAPLAEDAVTALVEIARDYASLEVDLTTGQRSQRIAAVERLLIQLTGAEAAAVVNNNAGATLLTLAALATGREVIVSRGQLVEIGGSYRLPEVMQASGARLREVGTTNKTRLADYQAAICDDTAALMHVHTSNYVLEGFVESTPLTDLVALAHREHRLAIDDIGSGALWDFGRYGIGGEPRPQDSLACGADVVLMSGDKLLGGPQCGIIVGQRACIDAIVRHPLARALRVDKLTLAALAATLRLYRDPDTVEEKIPLLTLLSTSVDNLQLRAERLAPQLAACPAIAAATPRSDTTYLGGGSVPTQQIPTWCVALTPAHESVDSLAARLRRGHPAVMGRVHRETLLLDLRSVFARQDQLLVKAVQALANHETEKAATSATGPPADPPQDAS